MNHRSPISLSRSYAQIKKKDIVEVLPANFFYSKQSSGFDMWEMIETESQKCWMDDYVLDRLANYPHKATRRLDIWSDSIEEYKSIDTRSLFDRLIFEYFIKLI